MQLSAAQLVPAGRLTNVYPPSAGERAVAPAHLLAFADAVAQPEQRFILSSMEYGGQRLPVLAWTGMLHGANRGADIERALKTAGMAPSSRHSLPGLASWCGPDGPVEECVAWHAEKDYAFVAWLFFDQSAGPSRAQSLASLRAALPHLAMNAELEAILKALDDAWVEQLESSLVGFSAVFVPRANDPSGAALQARLVEILRANQLLQEGTAAPVLGGQGASFGREGTNLRAWIVLAPRSENASSVEPGVRVGLKVFRK